MLARTAAGKAQQLQCCGHVRAAQALVAERPVDCRGTVEDCADTRLQFGVALGGEAEMRPVDLRC